MPDFVNKNASPTPGRTVDQKPVISLESRRREAVAARSVQRRAIGVKDFADEIHGVMTAAIAAGISVEELTTVMSLYIHTLVMCSFEGLHPEKKRTEREKVLDFLAKKIRSGPR